MYTIGIWFRAILNHLLVYNVKSFLIRNTSGKMAIQCSHLTLLINNRVYDKMHLALFRLQASRASACKSSTPTEA